MPDPSIVSPNVGNLQVGKGIVSFMQEGTSMFRDLGNVTAMAITPNMTTLDHFSSREGVRKKDLTIIIEKQANVTLTMEEMTAQNIAIMLLGDVTFDPINGPSVEIFSRNTVTGWLRFTGTNEVGPKQTVDLYYVSFSPSGDYGLISDEWNNFQVSADVLVAPSGPNQGKFGTVQFTNVAPPTAPTIDNINPVTGPVGTPVTITGTNFQYISDVLFDTLTADDAMMVSDTEITCKMPTPPPGTTFTSPIDVTVKSVTGDDATLTAAFTVA
jgi:hypothetical protein